MWSEDYWVSAEERKGVLGELTINASACTPVRPVGKKTRSRRTERAFSKNPQACACACVNEADGS